MDVFVEQLIKKAPSNRDLAFKILIGIGSGLVSVIALLLAPIPINLFAVAGALYGGYFLLSSFDCEYEYIVTNGEIDIDKIVAKRKRKRLLTVKVSSFERFGELINAPAAENGVTVIKVNGVDENIIYYADFKHSSHGNVRLIFSPEEKVLEAVKPFLPRIIRANMNKQK